MPNQSLISDPVVCQPGFDFKRKDWSLLTAAVIISLTGWDLHGIHKRQTRVSEKPIFHRRYRGPIVLKIAVELMLDRRKTTRCYQLCWKAVADGTLS